MTDPYSNARIVEARSLALLGPFLEDLGGRYVLTHKGKLARHLQEVCGDLLFNDRRSTMWGVEIKAEERYTGNLFLETWSNRNLKDPRSHADRGSNPGWMFKSRADLLFYHFLDADALYVIKLFALQQWAFCAATEKRGERAGSLPPEFMPGRIWDFPLREQKKREQLNDTWGRIVPVSVLSTELDLAPRRFSVQQLRLDLLDDAA